MHPSNIKLNFLYFSSLPRWDKPPLKMMSRFCSFCSLEIVWSPVSQMGHIGPPIATSLYGSSRPENRKDCQRYQRVWLALNKWIYRRLLWLKWCSSEPTLSTRQRLWSRACLSFMDVQCGVLKGLGCCGVFWMPVRGCLTGEECPFSMLISSAYRIQCDLTVVMPGN